MRAPWGALVALAMLGCACNGGDDDGGSVDAFDAFFPTDLRASDYTIVRDCREPGEHSGLAAFTVWASPEAASALAEIWQDPPARTEMPAGSIVVKESYRDSDCEARDVDHWAAMQKVAGFDPPNGDWHWQELSASGDILADGKEQACTFCHAGSDETTCRGFGQLAGRDYLCTVP